ncbi:MAG: hypothetical protein MUF18_13455 [Fimbriiglobus sp.]|jgi:hypothetical protein|nr:hypothetical protein [Fimbriiglobus sp.]
MPLITLFAHATTDQAMDIIASAARHQGYVIDDETNTRMTLRLGSVFMSILLGIFVKYIVIAVRVKPHDDDEVRLTLEWENPWWRGIFASSMNASTARALADLFEEMLEEEGGEVLERKGG